MVESRTDDHTPPLFSAASAEKWLGHIVLRPNNSMTWKALQLFLLSLALISLTVAFAFTWAGYWMILPFTVLELSVVGAALYAIARRNNHQEVLYFSRDTVSLEVGRKKPEQALSWPRFYSKFVVEKPAHPWYTSRVLLRHREQSIELGRFLNSPDKKELLRAVREQIALANHQTG